MLTAEGTADQDPLQRLGHVEPGAGERGVERHNAVLEQPAHHVVPALPRAIVPDQEQSQGRGGLGAFLGPPPVLPGASEQVIRGQGHAHGERIAVQRCQYAA